MAGIGDAVPPGDDYILRRLATLEAAVQQMGTALTLQAATIGAGGLTINAGGAITVNDPVTDVTGVAITEGGIVVENGGSLKVLNPTSGASAMYLGSYHNPNAVPPDQMMFVLTREDGTVALEMADGGASPGHPQKQDLAWFDRSGNPIVADDTNGGWGLANPHIPASGLAQVDPTTWKQLTGPLSTWTDLISGWMEIQNPRLQFGFWLYSTVHAAFRILVNGVAVGTQQDITNAWGLYQAVQIPLPAGVKLGDTVTVTVQGWLYAAGSACAACLFLSGDQSP